MNNKQIKIKIQMILTTILLMLNQKYCLKQTMK